MREPAVRVGTMPYDTTQALLDGSVTFDGIPATVAKNAGMNRYRGGRKVYQVRTMLPWANALFERITDLFPADWWPYGLAANRTTIDTFLRYHFEQGLSLRRTTCEELFAPDLLDT